MAAAKIKVGDKYTHAALGVGVEVRDVSDGLAVMGVVGNKWAGWVVSTRMLATSYRRTR
jgi:hypothetical protein